MYRAIARNRVLSNSENSRKLPASWYGLYRLSRLPEPVLEEYIADENINADMTGKDITAVIREVTNV